RDDPFAGVLSPGNRGSSANDSQPGILSARPPETTARHQRPIDPVLTPSPPYVRKSVAPSARMISSPQPPYAFGVDDDDDCSPTFLFPPRVTLNEHYRVTSGERRSSQARRTGIGAAPVP